MNLLALADSLQVGSQVFYAAVTLLRILLQALEHHFLERLGYLELGFDGGEGGGRLIELPVDCLDRSRQSTVGSTAQKWSKN